MNTHSFLKKVLHLSCLSLSVLGSASKLMAQDDASSEYDTIPYVDRYYEGAYDADARAPMALDERRRPPFDRRRVRPSYLYSNSYSRTLSLDSNRQYTLSEQIGGIDFRSPMRVPFEFYVEQQRRDQINSYWRSRTKEQDGETPVGDRDDSNPRIYVGPWLNRVFGGSYVEFEPNVVFTLGLSPRWSYIENPTLPLNRRRNFLLDLNQQLSTNVTGKIGKKLDITFNYDTQSPFGSFNANFKNNIRMEYTGFDEDIIKKMIIGNVSMESGNSLIRGSQSLFGVKTKFQFGRLYLTNVVTSQRSSADNLSIDEGTQSNEFSIVASNYQFNQHFFLGHFFRDNYEAWLEQRPQVTSGINITRVEVYIINRSNEPTAIRQVLAMLDLGESSRIHRVGHPQIGTPNEARPAGNESNQLFASMRNNGGLRALSSIDGVLRDSWSLEKGVDYEVVSAARKLNENEYEVHPSLGYIRLLRRLQNDEVLAVSYEYTYNGERYKVGELSEDYQSAAADAVIFLKLLRPSRVQTELPSWNLMMKNIYAIGTGSIDRSGFGLQIHYRDDIRGFDNPNLQEGANVQGRPLVELLGLDRLNPNNDPPRDGNFDYLEGITVHSNQGLIVFPVLEPFGATLRSHFDPEQEQELIERYVFERLYRSTQDDAEALTEFNKYTLNGEYSGSSSNNQFQLPAFGVVENSVRVTAGGIVLTEGQDYTVNYNTGRVTVTNSNILASGKQIDISYEKNDFLTTRNRTLIGTRLDYDVSDELTVGSTLMYLTDQVGSISRYQLGSEPIRNLKYGFDVDWSKESLLLTKVVDKLPLLSTAVPSKVNMSAEFAHLLPGTSNLVGDEQTFYIDDFESTTQPITLGHPLSWKIASAPALPGDPFDKTATDPPLGAGYKRARLSWYRIDPDFYRPGSSISSSDVGDDARTNHYMRQIRPQEVFPLRDVGLGVVNEQVMNLAYYPRERGPYNYNPGLIVGEQLTDPRSNWGGITRNISYEVDFDRINVQYLEFWLMDPFIEGSDGRVLDGAENRNNTTGGRLVFNLGDVSEDVIKDGLHGFEQGLPAEGGAAGTTSTPWGRVPAAPLVTQAFSNDAAARTRQDVGYDGLGDEEEQRFFSSFLSSIPGGASDRLLSDVSADNFSFYIGDELDARQANILERYRYFNNPDGNTPLISGTAAAIGTSFPDNEDINQDNRVSDLENYYEYSIDLRPGLLGVNQNYIVEQITGERGANWYLFRIPVRSPERTQGNISGFKSIKFIRMYLTDFEQPVVLRFVRMRLLGSNWNEYEDSLIEPGGTPSPNTTSAFSSVGIEENNSSLSNKSPYVLPPGISRDENDFSFNQQRYNEQSLQICVDQLGDGDGRAIFKQLSESLVNYERLRMFFHVHGEGLSDGDLEAFIRIGADYSQNYYEVSVPLKVTPSPVSGSGIDRLVWPEENEIDLALDELYAIKLRRDRESASTTERYARAVDQYTIFVVGRPRLSQIEQIMIGVRNPLSPDRMIKSGCIWANELRATGVERKNGWGANVSLNTQLADFAETSLSTRYSTTGFGEVQDRIEQRSLESRYGYDVSSTLHLDKLVPPEVGLRVPLFLSYQADESTPEYDPLNSDVPMDVTLLSLDGEERSRYEELAKTFSQRRSIALTNVGKEWTNQEKPKRFYHIENFSASYAYNDRLNKSINIDHEMFYSHTGNLSYNFSRTPQYLEPFKRPQSRAYMWWIDDFNLNLLPHQYSFNLGLNRQFQRRQLRNAALNTVGIDPVFEKSYTFDRNYGMQWSIFRSLTLSYDASVNALIDEPPGDLTSEDRRVLWEEVLKLGRAKNFTQNMGATYTVPLNKFPVFDWTNNQLGYQVGYMWRSGSLEQIDELGHSIENSRQINWTSSVDLNTIYNKLFRTAPRDSVSFFAGLSVGILSMLKNVNASVAWQAQTLVPGFTKSPEWLGNHWGSNAPGWSFLLGSQDPGIRLRAAEQGWLVQNAALTLPFQQRLSRDISIQGTVSPFPDLFIQLTAQQKSAGSYQEIFRYNSLSNQYETFTPARTGSYSVSLVTLGTTFSSGEEVFSTFSSYRAGIRDRVTSENPGLSYEVNAQDVLIPSFVAAYTGRDPSSVSLSPFPRISVPNWQVTYQGLGKIPALQQVFSSINLNHGYTSLYAVGNFSSSLLYEARYLSDGLLSYPSSSFFENGRLVPFFLINGVGFSEQFAPLFGVSLAFKNRMTVRMDVRRSRDVQLNLSNAQINESRSNDLSIDYSYSIERLRLPFRVLGFTRVLENTLTLRLGFTLRSSEEWQRLIDSEQLTTSGNLSTQYQGSVEYALNRFLSLQLFAEVGNDDPRITNAFPRNRTAVGLRMRLNWSE